MEAAAARPEALERACQHEFDWMDVPVCIHCNMPADALPPVPVPSFAEREELARDEEYAAWLAARARQPMEREEEAAWFAQHAAGEIDPLKQAA